MFHFSYSTYKALLFALWSFLTIKSSNTNTIRGNLPSLPVIANFLNQYVKPYIHGGDGSGVSMRSAKETVVYNIVRSKINDLKPYLQDNDKLPSESSEKVKFEGEDETTILEFIPGTRTPHKNSFRSKNEDEFRQDIKKYKKLRKKINKMLNKEPVSKKTKNLVTSTLDDMLGKVVGSQCNWRSGTNDSKKKSLRQGIPMREREPLTLSRIWNEMWKRLRVQFHSKAELEGDPLNEAFLEHFQEFVSKIIQDTQSISDHYRVVCQLVNPDDDEINNMPNKKKALRDLQSDKKDDNDTCSNFRICSDELRDFMLEFYSTLNDTAVSTLRNYAAMFVRDVREDTRKEKKSVIGIINGTSETIEHKIEIIFQRKTEKFTLDKDKNKDSNIKALNDYIKKTINHVKRQVTKDLNTKLENLRPKLKTNIQKDIDVNLDLDLGNLERELSAKICSLFESCNGKTLARRQSEISSNVDRNSVYVKVQLTLDEKKLKKADRRIALDVGRAMKSSEQNEKKSEINTAYNRYHKTSAAALNVTRTTKTTEYILKATANTTAIPEDKDEDNEISKE